eukprot:5589357-Pyramimonas_sp.AAC.2
MDVKGYMMDVKGYMVDLKGYVVDVKDYTVDVKGYEMDVKAPSGRVGYLQHRQEAALLVGLGGRDGHEVDQHVAQPPPAAAPAPTEAPGPIARGLGAYTPERGQSREGYGHIRSSSIRSACAEAPTLRGANRGRARGTYAGEGPIVGGLGAHTPERGQSREG